MGVTESVIVVACMCGLSIIISNVLDYRYAMANKTESPCCGEDADLTIVPVARHPYRTDQLIIESLLPPRRDEVMCFCVPGVVDGDHCKKYHRREQ